VVVVEAVVVAAVVAAVAAVAADATVTNPKVIGLYSNNVLNANSKHS